ncbi:MAG: hypothetical protein AVDCRST_MAG68-2281, partial [uncultured Gemmatimonadetes bacterium]
EASLLRASTSGPLLRSRPPAHPHGERRRRGRAPPRASRGARSGAVGHAARRDALPFHPGRGARRALPARVGGGPARRDRGGVRGAGAVGAPAGGGGDAGRPRRGQPGPAGARLPRHFALGGGARAGHAP